MTDLLWLFTAGVVALVLIIAVIILDPTTKPRVDTESTRKTLVLS